jgi:DNA helicase HerA-like ATPase
MASQTTFSSIARKMRKYYVTLLVIDQRPSQIYDEVMSQLGTRISGWLSDEEDISTVLSGLAGRDVLRGMLARLQPAEEVLMLGWSIPWSNHGAMMINFGRTCLVLVARKNQANNNE